MNLLLGIILITFGILVIRFRYFIYEFTGEWSWATTYLGGNGTIVAIVLLGMFFIGVGAAYPFGVIHLNDAPTTQTIQFTGGK